MNLTVRSRAGAQLSERSPPHLHRRDGSAAALCKSDNLSVSCSFKSPYAADSSSASSVVSLLLFSVIHYPEGRIWTYEWPTPPQRSDVRCGDGWMLMCKHCLIWKVPAEEFMCSSVHLNASLSLGSTSVSKQVLSWSAQTRTRFTGSYCQLLAVGGTLQTVKQIKLKSHQWTKTFVLSPLQRNMSFLLVPPEQESSFTIITSHKTRMAPNVD